MSKPANDYSKTVRLPETAFPMRAGLAESEPARLKSWEADGAYARLREARKGAPRWLLHDGPPFANGDIHMGTALNKILKDVWVRYKSLRGFDAPYVPGWDCHGLPIEFKVAKALGADREKKTAKEIRQLCAKEAMTYVERQREQFKRLGVWGDWAHPYLTLDPTFEAAQLDVYWKLLSSGQLYRGLKPVHWCVYDQTALADAELEYKNHVSTAVYVKYRVKPESFEGIFKTDLPVYAVIWTTTPWTLPASLAITVNDRFDYGAYHAGSGANNPRGQIWILAKQLVPELTKILTPPSALQAIWEGKGKELEMLQAEHPFINGKTVRFCHAPYVTLEAGTGLVHTAPGHGGDDYVTGARYGLDTYCPVDHKGRYTEAFPEMAGARVTDKDTNEKIVEMLRVRDAYLKVEPLDHSYPHCWRCKNPIIFRATEQWFMSLENNGLRQRVLDETVKVNWITPGGAGRFANMMKDRADWCVSRQRQWGVPIYMFYCTQCGEQHFDEACYKKIRPIVEKEGGDAWFDPARKLEDFLPAGAKCGKCGSAAFKMERDTLDVWFDSGSSSSAVLKARPDQGFPADLYVEASDQYRGWFQSSMLVSCGVHGQAPYRAVMSHGWMLDSKGQAMHKSGDNAIDPLDVMKRYGADILRLWVASENVLSDLRFGEEVLKTQADVYRRIRNTFRWLLGNLHDFDHSRGAVATADLQPLDRWLLGRLARLNTEVAQAMEAYELQRAYARLTAFCAGELSSLVFDIHKDTLYTLAPEDPRRLSAQTALYEVLQALVRLFAPILVFTVDEVWQHMPAAWKNGASVHHSHWPEIAAVPASEESDDLDLIIEKVRPVVSKRLEEARAAKLIGHPYDAKLTLTLHSKKLRTALHKYEAFLPQLFIVSEVSVEGAAPQDGLQVSPEEVLVEAAAGHKCPRCWRRPGDVKAEGALCGRCEAALV